MANDPYAISTLTGPDAADPAVTRRLAAMELQVAGATRHLAYFHGLTMLPVLREGDEVQLESVTWRDVGLGDVVTYRFDDKFPTRRIVSIDRERRQFVIMGDSIPGRREYRVPFGDVLARVIRRQRDGVWLETSSAAWRWQTAKVLVRDHIRRAAWLAVPRAIWRRLR